MKSFYRIPLYLGFFSLIISILVSTVKLSENRSVTTSTSQAAQGVNRLQLYFNPPNIITVTASTEVEIFGSDVTLKFDPDKISILPSTLTSDNFIVTGGVASPSEFSFTLTEPKKPMKTGIIASFEAVPIQNIPAETEIQFATSDDKTAIYTKNSGINLLGTTKGVKFKI